MYGSVLDSAYTALAGRNVVIRCVGYHYIGKLVEVFARDLLLHYGSWLADSGSSNHRWTDLLASGPTIDSEIEIYPVTEENPGICIVNRSVIQDCSPWLHALPDKQI